MIDDFAKEYLHNDLREVREVMLRKLDGLSEYDIRRPLTPTGTNLLGLVKHLALAEARYFGEVFNRPFPTPIPRWDDLTQRGADLWATEHETREEITTRYRQACAHSDETITTLPIDAPGHVPWWPRPNVMLFNVLVHLLTETTRHAGHADTSESSWTAKSRCPLKPCPAAAKTPPTGKPATPNRAGSQSSRPLLTAEQRRVEAFTEIHSGLPRDRARACPVRLGRSRLQAPLTCSSAHPLYRVPRLPGWGIATGGGAPDNGLGLVQPGR
ncbi:DinB family protein [Actinokineospora sp. NPDC004072]